MKKRTKISLRTKIYLTLVGLLSLTGALYAFPANPFTFSVFPQITGLAATKSELFATGYVTNPDIYTLDCAGIPTDYQAAPIGEKYIALAPAQSVNAGFTPRDVFLTFGQGLYRATPPGPFTFFTIVPCSGGEVDHSGITFDRVGTFGNDMIFTCNGGDVFKIDNIGNVPHVTFLAHASSGGEIEGPVVAPLSFGTGPNQYGGQILVADEDIGEVNAIKNDGPPATVTHNIFNWPGFLEPSPEALTFIPTPDHMCTYCGFAFFQSSQQNPAGAPSVFAYPPSDFAGLSGGLLVTLESDQRIALVQLIAGSYVTTIFDNPPGSNILEGNSFVDCDVPTPTPTSTPTATATATFTPTATATFTPTATATATFTPTPTATATATATPTPTPTPTVTPTTCTALFVIGDLDAVVGNHVTFWSHSWWKDNHLSGVNKSPPSFKGFVTCTNNPLTCGDTWQGDPGNSGHPPDTIPADITVIVSSSITKSGSTENGNIVKLVTVHVDPCCYGQPVEAPGHEGRGIVTAVICEMGPQHAVGTTNPATNLTTSSAKLNGSLVPHGSTTVYFQWGPTTSYGHTTATLTKTGNTSLPITANISGLTTHHAYHYRIVATNSAGTRTGSDRTFSTP
jgi:hypothetical protein